MIKTIFSEEDALWKQQEEYEAWEELEECYKHFNEQQRGSEGIQRGRKKKKMGRGKGRNNDGAWRTKESKKENRVESRGEKSEGKLIEFSVNSVKTKRSTVCSCLCLTCRVSPAGHLADSVRNRDLSRQ